MTITTTIVPRLNPQLGCYQPRGRRRNWERSASIEPSFADPSALYSRALQAEKRRSWGFAKVQKTQVRIHIGPWSFSPIQGVPRYNDGIKCGEPSAHVDDLSDGRHGIRQHRRRDACEGTGPIGT
jgi:hypothetical protein